MADLVMTYDSSAPLGERLAPEVIAEIQQVAPADLNDGSVGTAQLATGAVTSDKIANGTITGADIAAATIASANFAAGAVNAAAIGAGAVGGVKAGPGVATAQDTSGNYISIRLVPITAAQYAALATPDPNTLYLIDG